MQKERLETLLKEAARSASSGPITMDIDALTILTDYADVVAQRILEQSAILAQGRHAKEISEQDIALILAKKLGEEVPGHEVTQELHHQTMKSSLSAPLGNNTEEINVTQAKKRTRGG